MMTCAYLEMYRNRAQTVLGDALDYAVNCCKISGEDFVKLFCVSSVGRRMEKGEPYIITGKSGIEIAVDVISETTGKHIEAHSIVRSEQTMEYWIGWAVAYYQWYSSRRYIEIFQALSYDEFKKMYNTLHGADICEFVSAVDERIREYYKDTNLKRIRTSYGCTQAELARLSGVTLRSIQMYEQRNKNINKASAETLYSISKVLGCEIEDLIEK